MHRVHSDALACEFVGQRQAHPDIRVLERGVQSTSELLELGGPISGEFASDFAVQERLEQLSYLIHLSEDTTGLEAGSPTPYDGTSPMTAHPLRLPSSLCRVSDSR